MLPSFLTFVLLFALIHAAVAARHVHGHSHSSVAAADLLAVSSSNSAPLSANVTKTVLQWSRQLRTCDSADDADITSGTARVIYALGDDEPASDTAVTKHSYTGVRNVNLFNALPDPPMPAGVTRTTLMTRPFFVDETTNTGEDAGTYYHCQGLAHNFTQRQHVVRVTAQVDYDHRDIVHHMLLFECRQPLTDVDLAWAGNCYSADTPAGLSQCDQVAILGAWSVGAGEFVYPADVGMPVGGDGMTYMMIQIHYHNPIPRRVNDSAGFILTTTTQPPKHEAIALAWEYELHSLAIPPRQQHHEISIYVPSACFEGLDDTGVNVFASLLHTHDAGVGLRVQHIRGGVEQAPIDHNPAFDFNYQQVSSLSSDSYPVLKRDSEVILSCWYNTMQRANVTTGGIATTNEMCLQFLWVYPASAWKNPLISASGKHSGEAGQQNYTTGCYLRGTASKSFSNVRPSDYTPLPPLPACQANSDRHRQWGQRGAMNGSDGTIVISNEQWLSDKSSYRHSEVLDDLGRVVLYWNATRDEQGANGVVHFAVEAQTSGWVGLGLSGSGSMLDADSVIGWVSTPAEARGAAAVHLTDRYNSRYGQPPIDAWQDVWNVRGLQANLPRVVPTYNPVYYNTTQVVPPDQPVEPATQHAAVDTATVVLIVLAVVAVVAMLVCLAVVLYRRHKQPGGGAHSGLTRGGLETNLLAADGL